MSIGRRSYWPRPQAFYCPLLPVFSQPARQSHFDGKTWWQLAAGNMEGRETGDGKRRFAQSAGEQAAYGGPVHLLRQSRRKISRVWGTASIQDFVLAFLGNQLLEMVYDSVPALHDGFDLGFA
jgi:hypothetical protein